MIPFASCMCFQGKGAHWNSTPGKKETSAQIVQADDKKICIIIKEKPEVPDAVKKKRPVAISRSEWALLHAMEHVSSPWCPPSSFQTPQRKRCRARLPIIRSDALRSALLDDSYQGVTKSLLNSVGGWAFNTFHLDVTTGGRSLSILMMHLFQQYGFLQHFHLDPVKVWRCFNLFESCYHASNPYHNSVHAADVTQAMHCFLQERKISSCITPVEAVSAILAAVTHDLDHPGVNQPFLIATSNHLATLYKNFSVLENHHWRMAISCLREARLFDHLDTEVWNEIEHNIHSMILATDITRQQEFLARFKRFLENDTLDLNEPQHRHFILQIALKCADLCNPCRPWAISQCWSQQVCLEFYKQGEYERRLNIPITPICDRSRSTIAKIQSDFFRFVVTPLFEVWHGFLSSDLSVQLIQNLHHNQQRWERKAKQVSAETILAVSPVQEGPSLDEGDDSDASSQHRTALPSFGDDDLSLAPWCQRRCSMPLSIPKLLPRTTLRRQSFPHSTPAPPTRAQPFPIHRSPHVSLRTLSAEQLQPRTSIVSLSGGVSVLGLIAKGRSHSRRLVHQPASFPPFSSSSKGPTDICDPSEGAEGCSGNSCRNDPDTRCYDSKVSSVITAQSVELQGQSGETPLNNVITNVDNHSSTNLGCVSREPDLKVTLTDKSTVVELCSPEVTRCNIQSDVKVTGDSAPIFHSSPPTAGRDVRRPEDCGASLSSCEASNGKSGMTWYTTFDVLSDDELHTDKEATILESMTSWCSQVSRSMSEEHPEPLSRGFDSPAPSWKSSSSSLSSCNGGSLSRLSQRRGSAPVPTVPAIVPTGIRDPGVGQRNPYNYGRRWSLAADTLGVTGSKVECSDITPPRPFCRELVRRHSFGILEPFAPVTSSESENGSSSTEPTSTGTTCSTRRSSTVVSMNAARGHPDIYDPSSDMEAGSCSSESHDVFPTCVRPPRQLLNRRRGSLPADIPISLMTRISTYASSVVPIPGSTDSIAQGDYVTSPPWRRSSAGEVLGALMGSSTSILAHSAKQFAPPAAASFSGVRRGSCGTDFGGGIGLWHTSAGVFSSWQNVCGVSKVSRTSCVSDASEDMCMVRRHLVGLSSGIAGVSPQRWWRGSAPFDLSLLSSASSGNLASGGLED